MRDGLIVRAADQRDIAAMSRLLGQLFSIESDFEPDESRQARGLQLLLCSRDSAVFVAEVNAVVVGMASIQVLVSTAEGCRVGLVEDVVVDEYHRGLGVGGLLLARLVDWAVEQSLSRLQLLADGNNEPAKAFYRARGWQPTELVALRQILRNREGPV